MRVLGGMERRQATSIPPSFPLPFPSMTAVVPTASSTATITSSATATTTPSTPSTPTATSPLVYVAVAALVLLVFGSVGAFCVLKRIRTRHKNPKYIPSTFLKRRWENWTPKVNTSTRDSTAQHLEPISERQARTRYQGTPPSALDRQANSAANRAANADLDRNTSVRSVMTLPPYRSKPEEHEQVLGREGERAGIDVVVEYPENEDFEEQRRDEEMEALYQVRLARRREIEEREELRRLRREARERNDSIALAELRDRGRTTSTGNSEVDVLRVEHARIRDRQRAVSSVSYQDVGLARHDGTRIRANSEESERPLLGDAASIAVSHRDRSGSVMSVSSFGSDLPAPGIPHSRSHSRAESPLRRSSGVDHGAMSSPEIISAEREGGEDTPDHEPPEYVNIALADHSEPPPDYASPTTGRAPELPSTSRTTDGQRNGEDSTGGSRPPRLSTHGLPSITVDSGTPISTNVGSENQGHH